MIPADVAKNLQVAADTALRPVAAGQDIADKLSGLTAGQKVMAQIQSLLPNGTYRAIINQRSITLALPFSAKSGDTLELLVSESDGKLTLAVVAGQGDDGESASTSARATLSRTGQLISTLYSDARDSGDGAAAVTLNANQPIATTPITAQDLLPQLKQAISQSGMFYEAHQAEWVEGRLSTSELLQEPQGKLSSPAAFDSATREAADAVTGQSGTDNNALGADAGDTPRTASNNTIASENSKASVAQPPGQLIAPQMQGLVQQQLEALATQNFHWQGQVWPGQEMGWEINEDAARGGGAGEEGAARWSTSLRLTLPSLGEIDARIRLQGNQITLSVAADNAQTRDLMRASGVALRSALDQAGIVLTSMGVAELKRKESNGQTPQ